MPSLLPRRVSLATLACALTTLLIASAAFAQTAPTAAPIAPAASDPPAADAPAFTVRTRTLSNGMRVVYSPQPSTARVAVWVSWNVGSANDPDGYRGLAHFMEHMMFQGTRHVRAGEFTRRLQRAGSSELNATTALDRTDYFEVVPAEQLPLALWLESDRIAFGPDALTQEAVDAERRVVLNEFAVREGGVRGGSGYRFLSNAMFPDGHPYRGAGDTADDLQIITPDHLAWFFQTYYTPRNATLIIAGDFDITAVDPLVESLFGTIRGGPDPTPLEVPPIPRATAERRVRVFADVTRQTLTIAWNTPAYLAPGDAALDLVADLLAGDRGSTLFNRLVASGIARSVSARQESLAHGSLFRVSVSLDRTASMASVLSIVSTTIDEIRRGEIDPVAFEEARSRFVESSLEGASDPLRRADSMSRYVAYWRDPDGYRRDIERYRGLAIADVRRAVRRWLRWDARVVETVEYERGAPAAGRVDPASAGAR